MRNPIVKGTKPTCWNTRNLVVKGRSILQLNSRNVAVKINMHYFITQKLVVEYAESYI